jgi:ABC-type multidrug transport system fused ATPase/permease subunit
MAGIILEGSILVKEGSLTIGEIMAFLLFMVQLISNFAVVAIAIVGFYSMLGASESMIGMMQKKPEIPSRGGN